MQNANAQNASSQNEKKLGQLINNNRMVDPEQIDFGEKDEDHQNRRMVNADAEVEEDIDIDNLDEKYGSRNPRTSLSVNNNPALRDSNSSPGAKHEVSTGLARRNMAIEQAEQREGGEVMRVISTNSVFGQFIENNKKQEKRLQQKQAYESSNCNI